MKKSILLVLACFFTLPTFAQTPTTTARYQPTWPSIDSRPIPTWFEDYKFGIFIHWGLFSVPAYSPARDGVGVYERYAEWYWRRWQESGNKTNQFFREFHDKNFVKDFKYQDFANHFKAKLFKPEEWAEVFKQSGAWSIVLTSKHHEGFTLWPSCPSLELGRGGHPDGPGCDARSGALSVCLDL